MKGKTHDLPTVHTFYSTVNRKRYRDMLKELDTESKLTDFYHEPLVVVNQNGEIKMAVVPFVNRYYQGEERKVILTTLEALVNEAQFIHGHVLHYPYTISCRLAKLHKLPVEIVPVSVKHQRKAFNRRLLTFVKSLQREETIAWRRGGAIVHVQELEHYLNRFKNKKDGYRYITATYGPLVALLPSESPYLVYREEVK